MKSNRFSQDDLALYYASRQRSRLRMLWFLHGLAWAMVILSVFAIIMFNQPRRIDDHGDAPHYTPSDKVYNSHRPARA